MIRRSRGFTLIEIAVAVAIAVVIAFMGWSVINQGIKNRTELREQQAVRNWTRNVANQYAR